MVKLNLLSIVNEMMPKRKIVLFNSFPDVSGNALALYAYIVKNRQDIRKKYKLIWCIDSSDFEQCSKILIKATGVQNHKIEQKKSVMGILHYLSAQFVISTHGYFPGIKTSRNQKHVNLWHGMTFKRIGRMIEETPASGKKDEADFTIATSEVFQKFMAKSFDLSLDKVFITGQPCNDALFHTNRSMESLGIYSASFKKTIIWMPTYRKSVIGHIRCDGNEKAFGVLTVVQEHFKELNELLISKNYLLIIKPHPMDAICRVKILESKNIIVIKNEDLSEKNVQLYELLGECDVLLTDYSSVFIDFLVTKKPIGFVCGDIIDYENNRGFCFNPPRNYLPGQLISNYEELHDYLSKLDLINKRWETKIIEINQLFNKYTDDQNSKRVCNVIFGV